MKSWRGVNWGCRVAKVFFAFIILSLFSPLAAHAADTFAWNSTDEVLKNGNIPFAQMDGGTANSYFFKYTTPNLVKNSAGRYPAGTVLSETLIINKTTPLSGLYSYTYQVGDSDMLNNATPSTVTVSDPNKVAPVAPKLITKGQLGGKILSDPTMPSSNKKYYNKFPVGFSGVGGTGANGVQDQTYTLPISADGETYGPVDISSFGGGLVPGKYQFNYGEENAAVCATGEFDSNWDAGKAISQLVCSGQVKGTLIFDLTYDETKNDGSGILKVAADSENNADELASPGNNANTQNVTTSNGLNIFFSFHITSPLDSALNSAITTFANMLQAATTWVMGVIRDILNSTADFVVGKTDGSSTGVLGPWVAMRNIGLTLLVMALIIIAFANALQVDIEQYGLNRMIPKLIISIIMAYASWLIVVFFFDFTKALQDQAVGLIGGTDGLAALGKLTLTVPSAADLAGKIGAILLLLLLCLGVLVCGFALLLVLIVRIVMLSFLLAVAPLAFILNIVPFTSSLYKQWWSEFFKWMFMGPVAMIIIALGSVIAASTGGGSFSTTLNASLVTGNPADLGPRMMLGLLIFAASLYMAATLPMQWGGKLMQGVSKNAKKFGGFLGKTSGLSGAYKNISGRLGEKASLSQNIKAARLSRFLTRGTVGTDPRVLRRAEEDAQVQKFSKEFDAANTSVAELRTATSRGGSRGIAAWQKLAKIDQLAAGDMPALYQNMGEQRGDAILLAARKVHPEWFMSIANGNPVDGAVTASRAALGLAANPGFNFNNIVNGIKQDEYQEVNHNSFGDTHFTNAMRLNERAAQQTTARQLDTFTTHAATGASLATLQVALGGVNPATGNTFRDEINTAMANPDITARNATIAAAQATLGGAAGVAPQVAGADAGSLGFLVQTGKI